MTEDCFFVMSVHKNQSKFDKKKRLFVDNQICIYALIPATKKEDSFTCLFFRFKFSYFYILQGSEISTDKIQVP